jgi:hypothetical protein
MERRIDLRVSHQLGTSEPAIADGVDHSHEQRHVCRIARAVVPLQQLEKRLEHLALVRLLRHDRAQELFTHRGAPGAIARVSRRSAITRQRFSASGFPTARHRRSARRQTRARRCQNIHRRRQAIPHSAGGRPGPTITPDDNNLRHDLHVGIFGTGEHYESAKSCVRPVSGFRFEFFSNNHPRPGVWNLQIVSLHAHARNRGPVYPLASAEHVTAPPYPIVFIRLIVHRVFWLRARR